MARDPSKTEKATSKRRDEARKKGSVARSQELPKLTVLVAGLLVLRVLIGMMNEEFRKIFVMFLGSRLPFSPTPDGVNTLFWVVSKELAILLLPLLLTIAVIAYLTQRMQVGSLWAPKVFDFDLSRLFNPMAGLKKLFIDPKTFLQLGKQVAMGATIAFATYIILKKHFNEFFPLFYQTVENLVAFMLGNGFVMVLYTLTPMLVIVIADLWYTHWDYEENLKMTKDEVKDEAKQSYGDPVIKQQQKQKMLTMMQRRMLKDVPKADVVITNPTHLACALTYDPIKAPAPVLVAKGADYLAQKIKEIARDNHIPIRENVPLARALYKSVEVGEAIPEDLYQAVAAILAQLDKFKRGARPQ